MLQAVLGAPPLPVVGSLRLVADNPQLVDMPQLVVVDMPLAVVDTWLVVVVDVPVLVVVDSQHLQWQLQSL